MDNKYYSTDHVGRDSSVGITTRYGLVGPEIKSRWGGDFPHPSTPTLGPIQPPTQWVSGLFPGEIAAWAWRWPTNPSSADVKERVEVYLYSPRGIPLLPLWDLVECSMAELNLCGQCTVDRGRKAVVTANYQPVGRRDPTRQSKTWIWSQEHLESPEYLQEEVDDEKREE
jgi:hypothetical protein